MEGLHPNEIDLGLSRVEYVAKKLGLMEQTARVITVAGTNGKGSFVSSLSALLSSHQCRYGAYTSPHIYRYSERICINGEEVSEEALCGAFDAIDRARELTSITYFEFATLAALYLFKCAELDFIILEVGLGGRLDAVNIVDADIAVITSIALDHEAWLGNTRESIAVEKAGILRNNIPAICVEPAPPKNLLDLFGTHENTLYQINKNIFTNWKSQQCLALSVQLCSGEVLELELARCGLPEPSVLAALQVFVLLVREYSLDLVRSSLESNYLEGRFELVQIQDELCILDVAHNPHATQRLHDQLLREARTPVDVLIAVMGDKDIEGMVQPMLAITRRWICTEIPGLDRGLSASELAERIKCAGAEHVEIYTQSERALDALLLPSIEMSTPHGEPSLLSTKLAFGSFYLITEIKALMSRYEEVIS